MNEEGCPAHGVGAPTSREVRDALRRVLASPGFERAPTLRRFLEYVVERALEGEANRLNAYRIAVDGLGRGADFDPQTDPSVRVAAGRLRTALRRYYLDEGAADPVRIVLDAGCYAPRFDAAREDAEEGNPSDVSGRAALRRLTLPVWAGPAAFAAVGLGLLIALVNGDTPERRFATHSLATRKLEGAFPSVLLEVRVARDDVAWASAGTIEDTLRRLISAFDEVVLLPSESGGEPNYKFVVEVQSIERDIVEIRSVVERVSSNTIIYSDSILLSEASRICGSVHRCPLSDKLGALVAPIFSMHGVLIADAEFLDEPPIGAICTLYSQACFDQASAAECETARRCLSVAIDLGFRDPALFALRSMVHLERRHHAESTDDASEAPMRAAIADAFAAVATAPGSARTQQAIFDHARAAGLAASALAAGGRAHQANPYDLDVLGDFAAYLVSTGRFEEATPLLVEFEKMALGEAAWVWAERGLDGLLTEPSAEVDAVSAAMRPGRSTLGDIFLAIRGHERGDPATRDAAVMSLLARKPDFAWDAIAPPGRRGYAAPAAPRARDRLSRAVAATAQIGG